MKTKALLFFIGCAVVTLSFTFSSAKKHEASETKSPKSKTEAPIGGIALEDKF